MSEPEAPNGRLALAGRILALLVTNAIKLGGLWISIHEIATQPQPRLSVLAVALFMMTGAQVSEEAVLNLAARMFGGARPPGKEKDPQ